ncbi:copper chaperone PCu(A)C [Streptomyces sp. LX-29]|uniref:copper chaperone PCu(A)C n=1 Tax=Streptomyces sp. LX-29 TaxID=2900152 RepID=UPI00240E6CAE|nr:copper chaperone PCu(A)C [Streptomyces sp. LX-29]WFB08400.1 copper chaperone PCu(A)C [Streptomyces sp. LX-29]
MPATPVLRTRTYAVAGVTATGVALALALTACGGSDGSDGAKKSPASLSVDDAYLPRPAMDDMAAGFLTVRNTGDTADRLTKVTTPLSSDVTLHATEGTRMKQVSSLDVPAGGELTLASGETHLMLGKLDHRPEVGEKVRFTLHFASSDPIEVDVPVKPTTYRPQHH